MNAEKHLIVDVSVFIQVFAWSLHTTHNFEAYKAAKNVKDSLLCFYDVDFQF